MLQKNPPIIITSNYFYDIRMKVPILQLCQSTKEQHSDSSLCYVEMASLVKLRQC